MKHPRMKYRQRSLDAQGSTSPGAIAHKSKVAAGHPSQSQLKEPHPGDDRLNTIPMIPPFMQVLLKTAAAQPSPSPISVTLENMGRCKCRRYRPMFSQCASPSNTGAATAFSAGQR